MGDKNSNPSNRAAKVSLHVEHELAFIERQPCGPKNLEACSSADFEFLFVCPEGWIGVKFVVRNWPGARHDDRF
jgi:hypothetical protein